MWGRSESLVCAHCPLVLACLISEPPNQISHGDRDTTPEAEIAWEGWENVGLGEKKKTALEGTTGQIWEGQEWKGRRRRGLRSPACRAWQARLLPRSVLWPGQELCLLLPLPASLSLEPGIHACEDKGQARLAYRCVPPYIMMSTVHLPQDSSSHTHCTAHIHITPKDTYPALLSLLMI